MDIVGAYGCSHAGLIVTRKDNAPPAQRDALFAAYASMGAEISALAPDAIVLIGTDHGRMYPLTHVPQFTIGVSGHANSIGDAGLPKEAIAIHQPFAQAILAGMIEDGVDLAYSEAMPIDHSFVAPLTLAFGTARLPIVPIVQNCNVPPLPTLRRSHDVGRALGSAIRRGPAGRVVVLGTGGLSHWVGSAAYQNFMREAPGTRLARVAGFPLELTDTGPINEAFDAAFLDAMRAGAARDFIAAWTADRIFREAGNGAQEIRNWLTVAGAVGDAAAEIMAYGAVAEWLTGTAIARFRTGATH